MGRRVDISRAARLAGVAEQEIERQIDDGQLAQEGGKIELAELLKLYPDVKVRGAQMVEIVSQIRDDAGAKALRRQQAMDRGQLLEELRQARGKAIYYREQSDACRQILSDLKGMLDDLRRRSKEGSGARLDAVVHWLEHKLKALE